VSGVRKIVHSSKTVSWAFGMPESKK